VVVASVLVISFRSVLGPVIVLLGLGAMGSIEDRSIAVTLQVTSAMDRAALFARACGLTPRESELLRHLADGTDTRQLARRLGLSEHTVQDHLKMVFAKTSTNRRVQLLARAFGS
jgi:DNA-binding CsgD family transcriptional regulator